MIVAPRASVFASARKAKQAIRGRSMEPDAVQRDNSGCLYPPVAAPAANKTAKENKPLECRFILLGALSLLTCIHTVQATSSKLPEDIQTNELVFVYVHGFGEADKTTTFESNVNAFFKPLKVNAHVFTYRWDWLDIDPRRIVRQWQESKKKAQQAAQPFMENIILQLEAKKIPYVIVAYSLGTRVVGDSLRFAKAPLQHLRGIYFLGSALSHTYTLDTKFLPQDMKVVNYHSSHLDTVLKVSFYNAEGVKAGGEIGFKDTEGFENYRTGCTHIHKSGPIQRDYSSLASMIASLTFHKEKMFIPGKAPEWNIEMPVGSGVLHWNDVILFQNPQTLLIQQNANTKHYRAITINAEDKRTRKAWGIDLHPLLKELGLFPSPYTKIIDRKNKSPYAK
ncbi:MAG: hypothetical protein O7G31_01250 [Calditrichaeota bacterium]|nr:hypothetical protein [Calditrichota bacterium]